MILRSALVFTVLLTAVPRSYAGDCAVHPETLIDLDIVSCAPLTAANAIHVAVSDGAAHGKALSPALHKEFAKLVAEHAAVVLQVKTRRTRTIQIDSPRRVPMAPAAEAWKPLVESRWLVFRTTDAAAVCTRFPAKKRVVLAHPTDCGCDTGPHDWCAVAHSAMVGEVPANLVPFST